MFSGLNDLNSAKASFPALAGFAEHPFTQRSLELVQTQLPATVGTAYRSAMDFWSEVPKFAHFESLLKQPDEVFCLHLRRSPLQTSTQPPILAMQVGLAEEWLREALDEKASTSDTQTLPKIDRQQTAAAIRCIRFHDAVLLCLAGLYSVTSSPYQLTFELTETGHRSMIRRHWAMILERGSQMAFAQQIAELVRSLSHLVTKDGSIVDVVPELLWKALETWFMDRFFSFGTGVIEASPYRDELQRVCAYCRWFSALQLSREAGETSLRVSPERAKSAGLDLSLLAELEKALKDAPILDKGIYRQGDCLSLGNVSLAHAIEVGKSVVLPDHSYQLLTHWLEQDFSINYLRAYVNAKDYLVREGVKRPSENGLPRFDCDFSVYDWRRGIFYFVQAKFKRGSRLATASDEIRALTQKNSAVTKGFDQIVQMRNRIDEASVVDAIRSRFPELTIDAPTLVRNSRYLVVHNTPEFNGLERDGVVMYEWNMFRNLLARGQMEASQVDREGISKKQINADDTLPLEDVEAVFEHCSKGLMLSRRTIEMAFADYADSRISFSLPKRGAALTRWFGRAIRIKVPLV